LFTTITVETVELVPKHNRTYFSKSAFNLLEMIFLQKFIKIYVMNHISTTKNTKIIMLSAIYMLHDLHLLKFMPENDV
jgi:hypothetical protein